LSGADRGANRLGVCPRSVRKILGVAVSLSTLLAVAPAAAQNLSQYDYEDLEFRGIGVEGFRIWPTDVEPASGFGILLDLGLIGPAIRIQPAARYWASALREEEVIRLADQIVQVCERQAAGNCPEQLDLGEVKLSDLELTTEAHYIPLVIGGFSLYVGLGLSLHLLNGRGESIDDTFVEDLLDSVAPGISPLTGFDLRLGNAFSVGPQARLTVASDVRYGSVGLSGTWTLPGPRDDAVIRPVPSPP
jgi:hypothetical protein